jgi:hypothetical protein
MKNYLIEEGWLYKIDDSFHQWDNPKIYSFGIIEGNWIRYKFSIELSDNRNRGGKDYPSIEQLNKIIDEYEQKNRK